jgi:rRNA-processing protein FCF1
LVEVICDTNFLIHLATKRIKNLDSIELDMGSLTFVVPNVVYSELEKLQNSMTKKEDIRKTLDFIKKFKRIPINGTYADKEILDFVKSKKSFVGTMDKNLKKKIKAFGSNIISLHNDNLILES